MAEHGARLRLALDRMKLVAQGGVALAAAGVVALLSFMAWNAANDRGLVINRFIVPPDLADRQIRGEDFAALVGDKLATLQAKGQSFRNEATFQSGWGKDIKIAVPGAGISFGDLDRGLRDLLGHETRVDGTLYHDDVALKLSMRAGDGAAIETAGDAAHLDALAQKAAEALLERIEPYRYSKYLEFSGRKDEALAVARRTAASDADAPERAWAWAQISNLLTAVDIPAAAEAGRRAMRLDPDNALAALNTDVAEFLLGHDQAGAELMALSVALAKKGGGLSPIGKATSVFNEGNVAVEHGDFGRAAAIAAVSRGALYAHVNDFRAGALQNAYAQWHDLSTARRVEGQLPEGAYVSNLFTNGFIAPAYAIAAVGEDWPAAERAAREQLAALAPEPEGPVLAKAGRERWVLPNLAIALARQGKLAEAQAITGTLPRDCYLCLRAAALTAGLAGDLPSADRLYAEAVRRNPGLSFADLEWGGLRLQRGDAAGSVAHFARAAGVAPRFADPLKGWGDALAALKQPQAALEKYAAAAERAPRWGGLHLAWGEALLATGDVAKARAQFDAARGLDLTAAERLRLARADRATKPT